MAKEPKPAPDEETEGTKPKKNPHAVAMGKIGGPKGGRARAKKLSPERRREIAMMGVEARRKKKKEKE